MSIEKRPRLLAAAVFAGALGLLVPLTLYAEAGTSERVRIVAPKKKKVARAKKPKAVTTEQQQAAPVQALVVKKSEEQPEKAKAKAKVKARKFLPVAHVGDY